ncbi:hypothetical protein [Saccharopolyspora sp. NPDC049426]|uniref:hypothetical protein n=1 Tax=Saccharopolyspora sp. NPDC049426 TaxID=3155652 RepID=UPI003423393E
MPTQPGWNQQWGPHEQQRWHGQPVQGWQPPPPQPPKKRKKWPFIVVPIVALLLVFAVVRGSYELSRPDIEPIAEAPAPTAEQIEETTPTAPPPPGAPVRCQPDLVLLCFPDDYDPDATMDAIAAAGWTCYRKDDRTEAGNLVFEARRCEVQEQVGQQYGAYTSHGYERDFLNKETGKLESFTLSVNTIAALQRGEHTTPEDSTRKLFGFFDFAAERIWFDKPDQLREAKEAFERLKPQCASPAGRTIEGATVTTPSGYELNCSAPGGSWQVGDQSKSYQQTLTIKPAT